MRLLFDENIDAGLPAVLESLGHDARHVGDFAAGAEDPDVAALAGDYDVLVTLDLHSQVGDWVAVNEAILERGVRVIRLRFGPTEGTEVMDQARALIAKWDEWERDLFSSDGRLATIQHCGMRVRVATRDEVEEMLRVRLDHQWSDQKKG